MFKRKKDVLSEKIQDKIIHMISELDKMGRKADRIILDENTFKVLKSCYNPIRNVIYNLDVEVKGTMFGFMIKCEDDE